MTNDRLSVALRSLSWGPTVLARRVGVSERSVRYWLTGRLTVPATILTWLEALAAFVRAHPPPPRLSPPDRETSHAQERHRYPDE